MIAAQRFAIICRDFGLALRGIEADRHPRVAGWDRIVAIFAKIGDLLLVPVEVSVELRESVANVPSLHRRQTAGTHQFLINGSRSRQSWQHLNRPNRIPFSRRGTLAACERDSE